jgi:hypothetical protein
MNTVKSSRPNKGVALQTHGKCFEGTQCGKVLHKTVGHPAPS